MPDTSAPSPWPAGPGEMAERIRTHDWAATPLGPIETWPQSLRIMVALTLGSPVAAILLWGPAHLQIYNDRWRVLMGDKHPAALGQPTHDCFPEIAATMAPVYERVRQGEAVVLQDARLPVGRHGAVEDAWWTVQYTPLHDADGAMAGIFCTVVETTAGVLTQRDRVAADAALRESDERQAFLLKLNDGLRLLADPAEMQDTAMRMLGQYLGVARAHYHEPDAGAEHPDAAEGRFTGRFQAGQALAVDDAAADPRVSPEALAACDALGLRAFVGVSLVKQGRLVAALGIHNAVPRGWTAAEVSLIAEAGERTWAAVQRARADAALRENEERQAFLLALADRLAPLDDAAEVLSVAARALRDQLGADRVGYAECRARTGGIAVLFDHVRGVPSLAGRCRLVGCGPEALGALRQGRSVVRPDIANDPGLTPAGKRACARLRIGAAVDVPLLAEGALKAVLFLHFRQAHPFSRRELALLQGAAGQAWATAQRVRAEAALRESEARFRAFVTASSDMVYRMGPDWSEMRRLEGRTFLCDTDQPSTTWLARYIHREDQPAVQAAINRAIRTKSIFELEHRVIRADGSLGWILSRAVPILTAQGEIKEWLGAASDVTAAHEASAARARAEEVVRESEERLRALVEGIPQLVWHAGQDGGWQWASRQWAAYTGRPAADSRGEGWLASVHPADRAAVGAAWRGAVSDGRAFRADHRLHHAAENRHRWTQSQALPVRGKDGGVVGWLGTTTDVEELRRVHEQDLFIAELQHRGRNLLAVAAGVADQTAATCGSLEQFGPLFDQRLGSLGRVQNLLSRDVAPQVTVNELVWMELAAHGADALGASRVRVHGPDAVLPADAVQVLALGLHELTTNAFKHGALRHGGGGRLDVRWDVQPAGTGLGRLRLDWVESGVAMPDGGVPPHRGFGLDLLDGVLPYELLGETRLAFGADGVHCSIDLPLVPPA